MGTSDTKTEDADEPKSEILAIPVAQRIKRFGMDFYENTLGAPKYVVSTIVLLNLNCLVEKMRIKLNLSVFFFAFRECLC